MIGLKTLFAIGNMVLVGSQEVAPAPGSQMDDHGCYGDGGYGWCDSLQECIRPWEIECPEPPMIPHGCASWFDGCNTCQVENDVATVCTLMMCFVSGTPECLSYWSSSSGGH